MDYLRKYVIRHALAQNAYEATAMDLAAEILWTFLHVQLRQEAHLYIFQRYGTDGLWLSPPLDADKRWMLWSNARSVRVSLGWEDHPEEIARLCSETFPHVVLGL